MANVTLRGILNLCRQGKGENIQNTAGEFLDLENGALRAKKKQSSDSDMSGLIDRGKKLCQEYAMKGKVSTCQKTAEAWIKQLLGK